MEGRSLGSGFLSEEGKSACTDIPARAGLGYPIT